MGERDHGPRWGWDGKRAAVALVFHFCTQTNDPQNKTDPRRSERNKQSWCFFLFLDFLPAHDVHEILFLAFVPD